MSVKTQRTLGSVMLFAGIALLFAGFMFPLVTVVIDTTPPEIGSAYPNVNMVYASVDYLEVHVRDVESGIKSVKCDFWDSTYVHLQSPLLFYKQMDGDWEIWYLAANTLTPVPSGGNTYFAPIKIAGTYMVTWEVINKNDVKTTLTGTFTVYPNLLGEWYLNTVLITSPTQTVYSTTPTIDFKFVKTAGVADNLVTCTVWEGSTKLLTLTNSATSTWTGSYTFANGKHTLDLKASDGTQTVTMSVIGLQVGSGGFELPQLNILQISGLASAGIGLVLIVASKKRRKT